jgi:Animal haem peroxidase/Catalase
MAQRRDGDQGEMPQGGGSTNAGSIHNGDETGAGATPPPPFWREDFLGGSPDAEQRRFRKFARTIRLAQARGRTRADSHLRALHAKMLAGTHDAVLQVDKAIAGSYFARGASYHTTVRFSSASGRPQSDGKHDLRGIALRVHTDDGGCDLLMTNSEVSHIRDAAEFMSFTSALAWSAKLGPVRVLLRRPIRGPKMVWTAFKLSRRPQRSLGGDTFWSRAPYLLDGVPVRYHLEGESAPVLEGTGEGRFFDDLARKLARGEVRYGLWVQPYFDADSTPLEDASRPWTTERRRIATLILNGKTLPGDTSTEWREIDAMRFDPWNTYPDMRPIGSLNRARRYVYKAAQEERSRVHPRRTSLAEELMLRLLERTFRLANERLRLRWDLFGSRLGTLNLIGLRNTFRRENLVSTDDPGAARPLPPTPVDAVHARTPDGEFNDRVQPGVGARNARFGRNVRFDVLRRESAEQLRTPDVGEVSKQVLARTRFLAAPSVNLLAVAWIQFQVHDWFQHRESSAGDATDPARARLASELGVKPTLQSRHGSSLDQQPVPAYENEVTHWWDCSQIYGDGSKQLRERQGNTLLATLALDGGLIPREDDGKPRTGRTQNWWVGLEVLHAVFAREHNAICRLLRAENPGWSEQRLYDVARLINVATMAKIHTVEWTPAVFGHPTLKRAMHAHWDGLFGKRWQKLVPPTTELRNGIPGSPTDQFEVPFALTEEFVSVYRLHPMLPDQLSLRSPCGVDRGTLDFERVAFEAASELVRREDIGLGTLAYSLALGCAGQMRLHNYPDFLRQLVAKDGREQKIDLAAVEIFRDRERSVPRYNTFRQQFGLPRVKSFARLEVDKQTRATLEGLYESVDEIDLLVGLLSELPPKGFAISDTAFRVFVGMASRRLKSDRFLTDDYREEVYTRSGLSWIQHASFKAVLQRHLPELHEALAQVDEVFAPWTPAPPPA